MKLSLFDVTDPENPVELFVEHIGGRGTDSELLNNHRALLFNREKKLLAFPVTIYSPPQNPDPKRPFEYGSFETQGARVYEIDLEKGFTLRGDVSHLSKEDLLKAGYYGSEWQKYVQRMLYIGDTIYTASNAYIRANGLADLKQLGEAELRK